MGQNVPKPGTPESFKVLIKELQSLALDVKVLDENGEPIDLKQTFEDDDEIVGLPMPVEENKVEQGDLHGFGIEDEQGNPEYSDDAADDELFADDDDEPISEDDLGSDEM